MNEQFICLQCKLNLPCTEDHRYHENPLFQKFAFEPKIKFAAAYLYFLQGGIAQNMLYQLKYKQKKELGNMLGSWYAKDLKNAIQPDLILPVPIHTTKLRQRGYNQSDQIAAGMLEEFPQSELATDLINREKKTSSQTRKSKVERWENVDNVYSASKWDLTGKRVLVVDDVITTGATVGMLCQRLSQANVAELYVACIARGK